MRGATYYNVQLFKRGRKVLSAWPRAPHLRPRFAGRYRGRRRRVTPRRYRWYVSQGFGGRAASRWGARVGGSSFRVER